MGDLLKDKFDLVVKVFVYLTFLFHHEGLVVLVYCRVHVFVLVGYGVFVLIIGGKVGVMHFEFKLMLAQQVIVVVVDVDGRFV